MSHEEGLHNAKNCLQQVILNKFKRGETILCINNGKEFVVLSGAMT